MQWSAWSTGSVAIALVLAGCASTPSQTEPPAPVPVQPERPRPYPRPMPHPPIAAPGVPDASVQEFARSTGRALAQLGPEDMAAWLGPPDADRFEGAGGLMTYRLGELTMVLGYVLGADGAYHLQLVRCTGRQANARILPANACAELILQRRPGS